MASIGTAHERLDAISFLLRPSSLFVLGTFLLFAFILTFYDGYRLIYSFADTYYASGDASFAEAVEKGRRKAHEGFLGEVAFMQKRDTLLDTHEPMDARHKLRWLYKSVIEAPLYRFVEAHLSVAWALYAQYAHYAFWMTVALAFVGMAARKIRGDLGFEGFAIAAFALFAYIAFVSTMPRMWDYHSIIEMAVVAAGIYFSLCRRLGAFLLVLALAVANRESGPALGIVYAILNWRTPWFWVPVVAGPLLLAIYNFDLMLLPHVAELAPRFFVRGSIGYINIFNLADVSFSLAAITAMKTFAFFAPAFVFVPRIRHSSLGRRLMVVGVAYFGVLSLGTIYGNMFAYAMMVPILFAMAALAYPATAPAMAMPAAAPVADPFPDARPAR